MSLEPETAAAEAEAAAPEDLPGPAVSFPEGAAASAEGENAGPGSPPEHGGLVHGAEISDEEFAAARAHVIEQYGHVPPSLQRVIDRGGRFGLPVPAPGEGQPAADEPAAGPGGQTEAPQLCLSAELPGWGDLYAAYDLANARSAREAGRWSARVQSQMDPQAIRAALAGDGAAA